MIGTRRNRARTKEDTDRTGEEEMEGEQSGEGEAEDYLKGVRSIQYLEYNRPYAWRWLV
jgi:hypothetical protein